MIKALHNYLTKCAKGVDPDGFFSFLNLGGLNVLFHFHLHLRNLGKLFLKGLPIKVHWVKFLYQLLVNSGGFDGECVYC